MAEISDQALIRHQYQRESFTSPAPAPRSVQNIHAPEMESISRDASPARSATTIMASREASI